MKILNWIYSTMKKASEKIIVDWVAMWILFLLSISLIWLQKFLRIPFKVEAFVFVLIFLSGVLIVLFIAYIRINYIGRRVFIHEILWIKSSDSSVRGPLCKRCKRVLDVGPEDIDEQFVDFTNFIFNNNRKYKYHCKNKKCNFSRVLEISPKEMEDLALNLFVDKNSTRFK